MAYSAILKPTDYFNPKIYTGTGSSHAITGVGFQPDFTWIKGRSNPYSHCLIDAVRGVGTTIASNSTSGEYSSPTEITSFDSDGFTLGTDTGVNNNASTFVSWNWKANGAGSVNNDGSTASLKTSANTTSGFSIVTYTGNGANRTIGHGLGVAPKIIFTKQYDGTRSWYVGETMSGFANELYLDSTSASANSPSTFNSTAPTTSVFSIGTGTAANANGDTFIAYCFAPIKGFSLIGSYTGNGHANGPLINTGFKPAFVMIKCTTTAGQDWIIIDNKRGPFNPFGERLYPNLNNTEDTSGEYFNFLSNGFKVQDNVDVWNKDSATYIYMAFAEHPFVSNTGGGLPTTAR